MDRLTLQLRNECLRILCEICGRQALLPRPLRQISPRYDKSEIPLHSGGLADVWMGEYEGRKVAVKVLTKISNDLSEIPSVGRYQKFTKSAQR